MLKTNFKKTLVALFLQLGLFMYAQPKPNPAPAKTPAKKPNPVAAAYNDFTCVLHEETLNKVFCALGEITGTNDYSIMLISGKYHWTVINPRINLKPDSSDFTCDAKVDVGPFSYKTQVKGQVKIWYDSPKNQINVQITTAIFELYTKVLGQKVHIKDIELAEYFKDPFQFEGPKTMGTEFEFMTPDSVLKKIYIQPNDCVMEVLWKEIATRCEVVVSDKPINPPLAPPVVKNEAKPAATDSSRKKVPENKSK
jgi:hypothetical protein